ncbi:MAG: hypothetical protein HY824_05065 [Acidobacteria bacterium]|nr:hypothetical protein [Acidobacteriota bacterium]
MTRPHARGINGWSVAVWVCTAVLWCTLAHFVLGIPLQVGDSFGDLTEIQDRTFWDVAAHAFQPGPAYYRPLRWVQMKGVFDLSAGRYYAWYKGVQVAQIALCLLLFVRLLRPKEGIDAAAALLALAVLAGLHTFNDTVRETFPINHFMMVVIACLAAANLAVSRARWWSDAAAAALWLFAALTLESGVLVSVIVVAAYLAGLRGVSSRGVAAVVALTAGYVVLRFAVFHVGGPGLDERSSGFGFRVIERAELPVRFGGNPLPFYLYNIAGNVLSLLFGEPRGGVFVFVRSLVEGDVRAWRVLNVLSSTLTTLAAGWYAVRRARAWRAGEPMDAHDRLAATGAALIAADAVLGYAYSKDVIMSPAGVFYALIAYASARALLQWLAAPARTALVRAAFVVVLVVLSSAWSVRVVGLHWSLREQAMRVREDWATIDQDLAANGFAPLTPSGVALKQALQTDALITRAAPPGLDLPALRSWFDEDY